MDGNGSNLGYRYALVPHTPPEIGYKLLIVPADRLDGDTILPPPPFDELLDELRSCQSQFSDAWKFIHAISNFTDADEDEYLILGQAYLQADAESRAKYYFAVKRSDATSEWCEAFQAIAVRAALHLPIELVDELAWCKAGPEFGRWMAVVWRYSHPTPMLMGTHRTLSEPFLDSIYAIQRCPCLQEVKAAAVEDGRRTLPLSKPEIAKRYTGRKKLSRAEQTKVIEVLGKRVVRYSVGTQVRERLWVVVLDGLPEDVQKRLLGE